MNNLFLINEDERKRILGMHETATKKHYLSEQPTLDLGQNQVDAQPQVGPQNLQDTTGTIIKQGIGGDPYVYGKLGNDYYYAKASDGDNPNWVLATNQGAINSIKSKIYNETVPVAKTVKAPVKTTAKKQPVKTTTKTTTKPKTTTTTVPGKDKFKLKRDVRTIDVDSTRVGNGRDIKFPNPKTTTTGTSKTNQKNKKTPQSPNSGFILVWAFPEYEPKIDGKGKAMQFFGSLIRFSSGGGKEGTYGKLGHGGCVIVTPDGNATCYEFGRYPGAKKGYGKVLKHPLGKVAKIKDGQLINPKQVSKLARAKTFPPGPTMSMSVAVVKLPNPSGAIDYASVKQREYTALDFSIGDEDANCGTFTQDVAKSGGVNVGSFCYPTPIAAVNSFKDKSDSFFQI
jgi:hypothetical protein